MPLEKSTRTGQCGLECVEDVNRWSTEDDVDLRGDGGRICIDFDGEGSVLRGLLDEAGGGVHNRRGAGGDEDVARRRRRRLADDVGIDGFAEPYHSGPQWTRTMRATWW